MRNIRRSINASRRRQDWFFLKRARNEEVKEETQEAQAPVS